MQSLRKRDWNDRSAVLQEGAPYHTRITFATNAQDDFAANQVGITTKGKKAAYLGSRD